MTDIAIRWCKCNFDENNDDENWSNICIGITVLDC